MRLDEMQAGLLRVRLSHMEELEKEKELLYQFVIRCKDRDKLISYLEDNGIGTIIHYPIPPHLSETYQYLGMKEGDLPVTEAYANEVLSILLYNGMLQTEQDFVIKILNDFLGELHMYNVIF